MTGKEDKYFKGYEMYHAVVVEMKRVNGDVKVCLFNTYDLENVIRTFEIKKGEQDIKTWEELSKTSATEANKAYRVDSLTKKDG